MRRFIPVIAAVLCSVGFIIYVFITSDIVAATDRLIQPANMPALKVGTLEEGLAPGKYIRTFVNYVVDGDTLEVTYDKKSYRVRLLCIDTPESVKKGVSIQPYGAEASKLTKKLVLRKNVRLVFEKGLRDRYGRLLAYVILDNGENVNALLVRNGYARVEFVSPNTKNKKYFNELQKEAISEKAGMWSLKADKQPFVKNKSGEYIPRYWNEKEAS